MSEGTPDYFVHESSYVDPGARVGAGTKIWHFCHIMPGAVLGSDCSLGQNTFVGSNVVIGNNVKIQNNVSIYDHVTLEDDVFCGPSIVFTNVVNPRSHVSRKDEYRDTLVQRGASIGANATIVCGHTIGAYALVGAGSVVTSEVPPYALVYGNPTRQHGYVCQCGIKLELCHDAGVCTACHRQYQLCDGVVVLIGEGACEAEIQSRLSAPVHD